MTVRIAVMLDENTSKGGQSYELPKNYMRAIVREGALPYGIPYCDDFTSSAAREFDGFLSVGGGIAFPEEWYEPGYTSPFPPSERLAIETGIMRSFLEANKPVLGICHGMQLLGALHGCRLRGVSPLHREAHEVGIVPGTLLHDLAGTPRLRVNSRHGEGIFQTPPLVTASARSEDGLAEALEIPPHPFAVGVQWHQEDFLEADHPGNGIFSAFVSACR